MIRHREPRLGRRLSAAALLAAVLAGAGAPHGHATLGDEADSARRSTTVLTTHDPFSRDFHFHAVIRFVPEDPCAACRWHRHAGLPAATARDYQTASRSAPGIAPGRSAATVARFTRPSRGPPSLL